MFYLQLPDYTEIVTKCNQEHYYPVTSCTSGKQTNIMWSILKLDKTVFLHVNGILSYPVDTST